jgi:hypothetical protein
MIMKKLCFLVLTVVVSIGSLKAQDSNCKSSVTLSADVMSRYVWRGSDYGASPSVQPTLYYNCDGWFELGVWGAYSFNGGYSETDPYLKLTHKYFSLILSDYFSYSDTQTFKPAYFDFGGKTTNHILEASLLFKGPEKFPLSILAGTYFYGNDRKWEYDTLTKTNIYIKNYYSTYIELTYSFKCCHSNFDFFLGLTPQAGSYGNTFGVINTGINAYKKIKITPTFDLPLKASLIFNPQAERVFFVVGFTLS